MTRMSVSGLELERIDSYMDEFHLAQIQKYLNLKGPLYFEIIDDKMFPTLKYGDYLKLVSKKRKPLGKLIIYWQDGKLSVGKVLSRREEFYKVGFFNSQVAEAEVNYKYILGTALLSKLSPFKRLCTIIRLYLR
jgi:hypothetical protein